MKRLSWLILSTLILMLGTVRADAAPPTAEQQAIIKRAEALLKSLDPQFGDIRIGAANAVLHLGRNYYFLDAADAKRVLVEGWGNPESSVGDVLGLVFPAGTTFLDDTWGAVVSYDASGYIADDDAKAEDYDQILVAARAAEEDINAERTKLGLATQHLIGWAQPPAYDPAAHSLVWARNIRFGDNTENTLNYDVRLLGRRGVLSLNMISVISKLPDTRIVAARFAKAVEFEKGARYADFGAGDKRADYGLAGLVAAGTGAVVAKKAGLLAILAVAAKKFAVVILAAFAGLFGFLKRRFFQRSDDDVI